MHDSVSHSRSSRPTTPSRPIVTARSQSDQGRSSVVNTKKRLAKASSVISHVSEGSPEPVSVHSHNREPIKDVDNKFFFANDTERRPRPPVMKQSSTATPKFFHANAIGTPTQSPTQLKRPQLLSTRSVGRFVYADGTEDEIFLPLSYPSHVSSPITNENALPSHKWLNQRPSTSSNPAFSANRKSSSSTDSCEYLASLDLQASPRTKQFSPGLLLRNDSDSARRTRKIMDLEISNTSLVAINRSLEKQTRIQGAELRLLRKKVARASGVAFLPPYSPSDEDEDEDDSEAMALDEGFLQQHKMLLDTSKLLSQSIQKSLYITEKLLHEGKKALSTEVSPRDIGGRVLSGNTSPNASDKEEETSDAMDSGVGGFGT